MYYKIEHISIPNLNAEVKAYIYQQLIQFDTFINPYTSLVLILSEKKPLRKKNPPSEKTFLVKLNMFLGNQVLEEECESKSLFTSIHNVSSNLLEKLHAIQNSTITYQERLLSIENMKSGFYLH